MQTIRNATAGDIDQFTEVVRLSILGLCKDHYSAGELSSLLKQYPNKKLYEKWLSERVLIVAEEGGRIVGFAQYHPANTSIEALHVLPGYTSQGIGRKLVTKIEEIAKNLGAKIIFLESSLNAESFYQKCRYRRKAPGKYRCQDGVEVDVVEYEKELGG